MLALLSACVPTAVAAQPAPGGQGVTPLPTVSVDINKQRRRPRRAATAPRQRVAAPQPQPRAAAAPTQASRSGTVGYVTQRITTGTRTEHADHQYPAIDTVVTQQFPPATRTTSPSSRRCATCPA